MNTLLLTFTGGLTWSVVEYALHRFVGHGPRRALPAVAWRRLTPAGLAAAFNDEHLRHHADASYFSPTAHKVVAATAVSALLSCAGSLAAGPNVALPFSLGFVIAYATYEVVHRRIHTRPPYGAYGRWLRRHHLYHHFKTPRANHGVTSPLWDKIIGTEQRRENTEPLRVPRHLAPRWLLDEGGDVRAAHIGDYEIASAGRRRVPAAA